MDEDPPHTPTPRTETLIIDQRNRQLARLDVPLWPPVGAIFEPCRLIAAS